MKKKQQLFTSAVIVAAGRGSRMNMDRNKQFIDIGGKPVLAWTIQTFQECNRIKEIVVVVSEQEVMYCKQNIIDFYGFQKVKTIAVGGKERQESVYNGLKEIDSECEIVLIHDGARPFVKEESILNSISTAQEYGAACVGVPVKDTIKRVDEQGFIKKTLDRSTLWAVQTPQTFKYDLIMHAHREATKWDFKGTDDAVLVERLGASTKFVMGSYDNIKITTKEDLAVAEEILSRREEL